MEIEENTSQVRIIEEKDINAVQLLKKRIDEYIESKTIVTIASIRDQIENEIK